MDPKENQEAFAKWLVANKSKKGTPEFNKVADALRETMGTAAGIVSPPSVDPELPDNSLGAAVEAGGLTAEIGTNQLLNDTFDGKGWFEEGHAAVSDAFNENVYNPLAAMVGGAPREKTLKIAQDTQAKNQVKIDGKRADLAKLNYAPRIGGVGDIGSIGDAVQYGVERAANSLPQMAASAATGGALAPVMMAGQTNEALRDVEGLDPEARLAISGGAGAIMGVAENLGLGVILKGIPESVLAKMGVPALGRFLASKGVSPAVARTFTAAVAEGGTEAVQEGVQMGAEGIAGKDFADGEITNRLVEAGVGGAAAGTALRAGIEGPKAVVDTAVGAKNAAGRIKAAIDYGNDPTQVESDLRVADLFDRKKANLTRQERLIPGQVFKGVQDEIKTKITTAVKKLHKGGMIDQEQYDGILRDADAAIKQAANHNRIFDQEKINSLGLDPVVSKGLTEAFRDLDTASQAGLYKNASGPLERAAKAVSGGIAPASVGAAMATGNPLLAVGALGLKGAVIKGAKGLDSVMGLQEPEIMRRAKSRRSMADKSGIKYGDTTRFLSDLKDNADAGLALGNSLSAEKATESRLDRSSRRKGDNPGVAGFDAYIFRNTGLTPAQVDQGMLMLARDGQVTEDDMKGFFNNPRSLMVDNKGGVLIDKLHQLAIDGRVQRAPNWSNPEGIHAPDFKGTPGAAVPASNTVGTGIRNPESYSQTMANVADATTNATQSAPSPELAAVVAGIADARTKAEKRALLAQALTQFPNDGPWLQEVVSPLTAFGPRETKADKETTVYHSTDDDFDSFDISKAGKNDSGYLGIGIYLTSDPKKPANRKLIKEVGLSLSNPLRLSMTDFKTDKRHIVRTALGLQKTASATEVTEALIKAGYDGVILDMTKTGYAHQEVMVLNPKNARIRK